MIDWDRAKCTDINENGFLLCNTGEDDVLLAEGTISKVSSSTKEAHSGPPINIVPSNL